MPARTIEVQIRGDNQTGPAFRGAQSGLTELGQTAERTEGILGRLTGSTGSLINKLGALGLASMGFKAAGDALSGLVQGNADMEAYTVQLGTLMGSADKAKDRLAELAKFGAETPFELPELVRAEKVLQGMTTLEEVLRVTRIIIRRETDMET